jgi:hypothetical protein
MVAETGLKWQDDGKPRTAQVGIMYKVPAVLLVLLLSLYPWALRAQSTNASITGRVTDPSKAIIADAKVAAVNTGTNFRYESTTNTAGEYTLANLPPGTYRIEVEKSGFKKLVRPDVISQDALAVDFEMAFGSVSDSITVQSGAPLVNTTSATVSTVIESQQIETTPLNGRNVMNLTALDARSRATGGDVRKPFEQSGCDRKLHESCRMGKYQVGGAISDANITYVDGAPLNLPTQNWMGFIPTQDSIQEFRVETNSISPEYGEYYGAAINFTTKSGTNDFDGTVYEYFRNTALDANSFFNNRAGVPRLPLQQNQYGISLVVH